jgi:hypothetical protein
MRHIVFAVALYALALLSNCNLTATNQNDNQAAQTPTPEIAVDKTSYQPRNNKPEQVLIYCDLTSSIKEEGITRISEKLKQVLLAMPRDSVVSVRLVEKNLLGESPFSELQTPSTCEIPDTEIKRKRVEAEAECQKKAKPYIDRVDDIAAKIKILKPKVDVSCIMDTLESAHDFFKGKNKEKYNFRLIYFSDMIEQCGTNSVFICGRQNQPKKAEILAKIENDFNPRYNLKSVIGENISLIITTSDNPNYNCLSLSEQKDVWTAVFAKIGYSNLDISNFNYTQEIPDALKN